MSKIYQKNIPDVKTPVKRHFGGFTLIELLVVVLISGILAAVALPQYEKAVLNSRMSVWLPVVSSIFSAEQIYYMNNNDYTAQVENLDIQLPSGYSSDCPDVSRCTYHYDEVRIAIELVNQMISLAYKEYADESRYIYRFNGQRECHANENNKKFNHFCLSQGGTLVRTSRGINVYSIK